MKHLKITTLTFLSMLFSLLPSAWAGPPSFSVDSASISFPTPTESSLDLGYIAVGEGSSLFAIRVRIQGGDTGKGWSLYVRSADNIFSPGIYNKNCSDLRWKFDGESPGNYRRLSTSAQLVASGSGGQSVTKAIDLRMMLGWANPPAAYRLRMTFTLVAE